VDFDGEIAQPIRPIGQTLEADSRLLSWRRFPTLILHLLVADRAITCVYGGPPVNLNRDAGLGWADQPRHWRTPTTKTITTHKIDPDVDDARWYLMQESQTPGDPPNVVFVGEGPILALALARQGWHVTAAMTPDSAWRTAYSSLFGSPYRYGPVSALYFFGRPQDLAVQKARSDVNLPSGAARSCWVLDLQMRTRVVSAACHTCNRRNFARVTSLVTSSNTTTTGKPILNSSGGTSTTQVAIRTPSSNSTIAIAYGTASANCGSIGWSVLAQLKTCPLPDDLAHS
jgi:hypothetical protein